MASNKFHGLAPNLKSNVDVQLRSAFSDHNWTQVIRLADKRAKALKDPYYEAIKLAAETRLDSSAPTCAALVAADQLVKGKATPELDIIELYEWACQDVVPDLDYADIFGPLRSRWAKANPKAPAAIQCLRACIDQKDLNDAQQIAAALDKAYANSDDRRFMFWNITLTFLISMNTKRAEKERQMFSMLALRQLERAAEATETAAEAEKADRGLQTEEEFYLYYRVLVAHGTKADFKAMVSKPRIGAIHQFREGRQLLFSLVLKTLEKWHEWTLVFDLCSQALSDQNEDGSPSIQASNFAADRRVWHTFIAAANRRAGNDVALQQVQKISKKFGSLIAGGDAMFRKTISLALMEIAFRLPPTKRKAQNQGSTPRLLHLAMFLGKYYDRLSTFDDVRQYIEELSFTDTKTLVDEVFPEVLKDITDEPNKAVFQTLECKFLYFLSTCGQTVSTTLGSDAHNSTQSSGRRCRFCDHPVPTVPCRKCLRQIALKAIRIYNRFKDDPELAKAVPGLNKDPRVDLAIVVGTCLLKVAGVRNRIAENTENAAEAVDVSLFLSATLVLDTQLRETPGEAPLRLLLIQLYLVLGCVSYAYQLWGPMGVKRTIHDSLSPLIFDRISTVCPSLLHGSSPLMEPVLSYYQKCLSEKAPLRIWDAFTAGNYSSILNLMEFRSKLERSCTMIMAVLEDRHATRAFGGKLECVINEVPLLAHITDNTRLVNVTDYGSFPDLESSWGLPIQDFVRLGPSLSSERSHLGLLAEEFLDLITFKPGKSFKPAKPHEIAYKDRDYINETLSRLHSSLTDYLHATDLASALTEPEKTYYTTIALLCAVLLVALTAGDGAAERLLAGGDLSSLTRSIQMSLADQRMAFPAYLANNTAAAGLAMTDVLFTLTDMHSLSYLRDTGLAVLQTSTFALALHEKGSASATAVPGIAVGNNNNKTGAHMHHNTVAEMKALESAAIGVMTDMRGRIRSLKEQLTEPGWLDRVLDWTFAIREGIEQDQSQANELMRAVGEMVGGRASAEEWASKVLESWREAVKGWGFQGVL